jgi:2-amino-4-hydroxy-6-hydroxymethyldihydropteridine diphosphokinase
MHVRRGNETPDVDRVAAYLLFGSNLGDRRRSIERGLSSLGERGVEWTARSSFYETEPVGVEDQPWFLNLAARGEVKLSPRLLLAACKESEQAAGRRGGVRYGPRPLDIDILLYDEWVVQEPDLVIPHARLCERRFALVPLLEIAPDLVDSRDGRRFAVILEELGEGKKVAKSTRRES